MRIAVLVYIYARMEWDELYRTDDQLRITRKLRLAAAMTRLKENAQEGKYTTFEKEKEKKIVDALRKYAAIAL